MARVISISNHKGGVGKTTVAANLGFALARHFKILLIDLDPQANLSSGLGFENSDENIGKYFKEIIHFRVPDITPYVINSYVDIIPGNIDLIKMEKQLHDTPRSEFILKELLTPLKSKYDLIIIDCLLSFNLLTINGFYCSNLILVPAKPEIFSIHGIDHIKKFADENSIPFKIIFNQVNIQSLLHRNTIQNAKKQFNGNLLKQPIRNTIVMAEAFEHAKNIFHYKGDSLGAGDFVDLSEELLPYL
jgi:chromosome partitioning protein